MIAVVGGVNCMEDSDEKYAIVVNNSLCLTNFYGIKVNGSEYLNKYDSLKSRDEVYGLQKNICRMLEIGGQDKEKSNSYFMSNFSSPTKYRFDALNLTFFENNEGNVMGYFTYKFSDSEEDVKKLEQLRNLKCVAAVGLACNFNKKVLEQLRLKGVTDAIELQTVFSTSTEVGK